MPENTTLMKPLSLGWTGGAVEMTMIHNCANAKTLPQTGANGASVTSGISVESLLWDGVEVEKRDALQAGTIQGYTALWNGMNGK